MMEHFYNTYLSFSLFRVNKAHDAGIICMCLGRDSDNNTWLVCPFNKTCLVRSLPNFIRYVKDFKLMRVMPVMIDITMCPPAMILTLESKQFCLHKVIWKFSNVEYEVPKFHIFMHCWA